MLFLPAPVLPIIATFLPPSIAKLTFSTQDSNFAGNSLRRLQTLDGCQGHHQLCPQRLHDFLAMLI